MRLGNAEALKGSGFHLNQTVGLATMRMSLIHTRSRSMISPAYPFATQHHIPELIDIALFDYLDRR